MAEEEQRIQFVLRGRRVAEAHADLDRLFGRAARSQLTEPDRLKAHLAEVRRVKRTKAFSVALARLNAALEALYSPELWSAVANLSAGDATGTPTCLAFLEADPWCFRSGYVKETIIRHLRHVDLSPQERERVIEILVFAVKSGPRREFREYCRTARALSDGEFEQRLEELRGNILNGDGVRRRAGWMLDAIRRGRQPEPDRSQRSGPATS